jgi:hypothetical protein
VIAKLGRHGLTEFADRVCHEYDRIRGKRCTVSDSKVPQNLGPRSADMNPQSHETHPTKEALAALVSGRLADEDALAVNQHLAVCDTCRAAVIGVSSDSAPKHAFFRDAAGCVSVAICLALGVLLIGMLAPAFQKVHGDGARTWCLNNLKQMALAANAYHDTKKRMVNSGFDPGSLPPLPPPPALPTYPTYGNGAPYWWWCAQYQVLPYIEQAPLYSNPTNFAGAISTFLCPNRSRPTMVGAVASGTGLPGPVSDYMLNCYTGAPPDNPDSPDLPCFLYSPRPKFPMYPPSNTLTMSTITKHRGASNLILWGEGALDPRLAQSESTGQLSGYESVFTGGYQYRDETITYYYGVVRTAATITADAPGKIAADPALIQGWGSAHAKVTQFAFCDGSARAISNTDSDLPGFRAALNLWDRTAVSLKD